MHDPAIGRFTGVDPIADRFAWVSPYNYAENMVPMAIDLWGLQAVLIITIGPDVKYRGELFSRITGQGVVKHFSSSDITIDKFVAAFKEASQSDPNGIGFVAIWSHGVDGRIFGYGAFFNGIKSSDLSKLAEANEAGEIQFAPEAIVYLGACNGGTCDESGVSFAQNLAKALGVPVLAAVGSSVTPTPEGENEKKGIMKYSTGEPLTNFFNLFSPDGIDSDSEVVGSRVDVIQLFKERYGMVQDILQFKKELEQLQPLEPLPSLPMEEIKY